MRAGVIYSCGWRKRVGAAPKQRRKHTLKGGLFKGLGSPKKKQPQTTGVSTAGCKNFCTS